MANGNLNLDAQSIINRSFGGSFGEGRLVNITVALEDARQALDRGDITTTQFVDFANELAPQAFREASVVGSQGSTAASIGSGLTNRLRQAGLELDQSGQRFQFNLPQEFQQDVRESLIPENVTGELRERLLQEIPFDVQIGSERFDILREGVRQRVLQEERAGESAESRRESLLELSDILGQQREQAFNLDVPEIREQAQGTGLLRTTGLAEALSRRKAELQRSAELELAKQGLSDREKEILGREGALGTELGFGTAGLQRDLSVKDFFRQAQLARELAEAGRPQSGKTSSERHAQQAQIGLAGLSIGAQAAGSSFAGGGGKGGGG